MSIGFGRWNPFPRRFGGGASVKQIELQALLDAFAPGWDASEDTENYAECIAYAVGISMIWAINRRLSNQAIPSRMLENLTTWEEACKLRPVASDDARDRRARVAAKLRGVANNAVVDITAALSALLGTAFVELVLVPTADHIAYWPGINPGPPGYEWSSNRALVGVEMTAAGLSDAVFDTKRDAVVELLDAMLPSWMTFTTGVAGGFIVDVSIVDETYL